MGIMMDSVLWEVMVIMVISVGFPKSSMVIMMGWVMMAIIVVFSISIVMVNWAMSIMMDSVLWEIMVHWIVVGIMMSTMFWEVVVIMVISVGFPTDSMVIMMCWSMVVTHIMVFPVAIVVVGWSMYIVCIMVVDSMSAKMGINTMWVMDWGMD